MSDENNRIRIHAQITPQDNPPPPQEEKPLRWRSVPHPLGKRAHKSKEKLTFSDRLLRNSAYACALLLAILAMGNINQPWARSVSETVERALTMHIDLDESIGQLNFVRNIMPESALVFLNLSGESELAVPVRGEVSHAYADAQPWLMFACEKGTEVGAAEAGTVTAVSELSGGGKGILVDHGQGLESVYAYLSETNVQAGDTVVRGQPLGKTDANLYFELREGGNAIDPTEKMGL